jgi:hypothetical protein
MKTILALVASSSLVMFTAAGANAQDEPWWNGAPDAPQQQPAAQPVPQDAPVAPPQAQQPVQAVQAQPPQAAAPQTAYPAAPQVTSEMASQGEWVYTDQYGWTWVPYGSTTTTVGSEPYVYLYAPTYGWTWFVSPWGIGPFHYGSWGWGPRWGYRYSPHGWGAGAHYGPRGFVGGGVHYAPRVGVGVHYAPAYGGAAHFNGGGARGFGGGAVHTGGGGHMGGGGGHMGGGGGHMGGGGHGGHR